MSVTSSSTITAEMLQNIIDDNRRSVNLLLEQYEKRIARLEEELREMRGRQAQNDRITPRTIVYQGGLYHGIVVNGVPEGMGALRSIDGDNKIYAGEWRNGKRHGKEKAYYDYCGDVLWFEGEWREGRAHSGTLFPDADWHGAKNPDGSPQYPVTPIRWQAGQKIPNTDLVPGSTRKLPQCLQGRGLSGYFPADAL